MKINNKGGADMLMELALSTIIFFVVVFFLFGINIPKQQLQACASVVSADASLACETSLMNLMKATSPDGTRYSDFLMNSWINNSMSAWQKNVTKILDLTFESTDWALNVSLPNGTDIMPGLGNIITQHLGCNYTVPFPAALLKKNCGYAETKVPTSSGKSADVSFDTPSGIANFTITDDDGNWLGADCVNNCQFVQSDSIFAESIPSSIPNDATIPDSITLPVSIDNVPYELTVEERTQPCNSGRSAFDMLTGTDCVVQSPSFAVNVTLKHSALLKDCGLTLTLKTTNVTDTVNTCRGKSISG